MRRRRILWYASSVFLATILLGLFQGRLGELVYTKIRSDSITPSTNILEPMVEPLPLVRALLGLHKQTQLPIFQSMHSNTDGKNGEPLLISPSVVNGRPNSRIGIVSMFFGGSAVLKPYSQVNFKQYATYHGYTYLDASEDPDILEAMNKTPEVKNYIFESKFWILKHYMATGKYDWLFWCDSDSIFLNRSRSLQDAGVVDDRFDMVVPVGSAFDFHWGKIINAGHFALRASDWGRRFAEQGWQQRPRADIKCPPAPFPPINNWLGPCGGEGSGIWYWLNDQGVFHALSRSSIYPQDYLCHIKWLNMRDLNSESQWYDDGDLLIHYPGTSNDERIEKFKALIERADMERGIVRDKSGLLWQDLQDWRVRAGHFNHYLGVGWNVHCGDLFVQSK